MLLFLAAPMPEIIHLKGIHVRSLNNPHDDLPLDMQMFAQLIVDGNIHRQTIAVDSVELEDSQRTWDLVFGSMMRMRANFLRDFLHHLKMWVQGHCLQDMIHNGHPSYTSVFTLAILRHSRSGNIRLLGSVEIGRGDVLGSVKTNHRATDDYDVAFSCKLNKVNPDGPLLELSAEFTVSKEPAMEISEFNEAGIPETRITLGRKHLTQLADDLHQMYETMDVQTSVDSIKLWVMHERLLLLSHTNENRGRWLNILGDIAVGCYETSGTLEALSQAVCAYKDALRDDPGSSMYHADLGRALRQRFDRFGDLADITQSVLMCQAAVTLSHEDPDMVSLLDNLGNSLLRRFKQLGDLNDISQAVAQFDTAIGLTPDGHPDKPALLNNLGNSLLSRFEQFGDLTDISQAVAHFEATVGLTPDGHPDKPSWLSNLGNCLLRRFDQFGDLTDIRQAVAQLEAAVQLMPEGHPDKPALLNNLGNSLLHRFEQLGNLTDINQAEAQFKAAVRLTPDGHPAKPLRLSSLGNCLLRRFEQLDDLTDIRQAVAHFEAAVGLTPANHPDKPSQLQSLGDSLLSRFQRLGDLADISQAVAHLEAAVSFTPDGHPGKPSRLNNLGNCLLRRFERLGDLTDISQAVAHFEAAVRLIPESHPDKAALLNNLGNSLLSRFQRLGDITDISQAVTYFKAAVSLTSANHLEKPSRLNSLGHSLLRRFEQLSDLADINQAVANFEAAIDLTPDGHPDKPSWLNSLGNSLLLRFEHLRDLTEISQAVAHVEAALGLTPDGHPDKPLWLSNLGICLLRRFEQLGDLTDINQAVIHSESAIGLTLDNHPDKPSRLTNLGNCLLRRFERLGDLTDISQAVATFEAAVRLIPEGHPDKPALLNNLGTSLLRRFEQLGNLADISPAVAQFKAAVELTPDGHPNKPQFLTNLGKSLSYRFEQLHEPHDYQELLSKYTQAACSETGAAHVRFEAASRWAYSAQLVEHPSLLQAYDRTIELLPELAWLGLSIGDRHRLILEAGLVVRDAAAAAIGAHKWSTAVEWLEQGRSIIWGQILNLRTPVDDLRKHHPELADELLSLSMQLERAGTRSSFVEVYPPQLLQSVAQKSHVIAVERDQLLKKIRQLAGFERFLLSKPISELSLAATLGPVVLLNGSQYQCDALILMPDCRDEVIHIPLPNFTLDDAQALRKSLGSVVRGAARSNRLEGQREGQLPPDEEFSNILSVLWGRIVEPVLDGLSMTSQNNGLRRIWWCPTGPLAFLPIHAAGIYEKGQVFGSKLSDFFISSYTPSLRALIQNLQVRHESQGLQVLAVAQPVAHGQDPIPGTLREVDHIERLAGETIPVLRLEKDLATVGSVQDAMRKSPWAHFACHGVQDIHNPTDSALLLAGTSRLTLSSIIQLRLPDADLAFLSACQTATGSNNLADESVHLTAGMLLAGYRGVIGTMWSIMDNDGPQVAADVYGHLFKVTPPDSMRAAEALHLAVRKLQDSDQAGGTKSFSRWVPFIHVGI